MNGELLMRKVAAGFEIADLRPLLDAIDDDVVWKSGVVTPGVFRFGGVYRGRVGVVQVTSQIATSYVFRRLCPRETGSTGDLVWGLFDVEADHLPALAPSGPLKPVKFELGVRWRLRQGRIVEHRGFFDTSRLLSQQLA